MGTDLQIKKGDTRGWTFTLTDSSGTALNLTSATVEFTAKVREGDTTDYFDRDSSTDDSDLIKISDAANGIVIVYPTASDYTDVTKFGIYVAEFLVTTSAGVKQATEDVLIDIQEAII